MSCDSSTGIHSAVVFTRNLSSSSAYSASMFTIRLNAFAKRSSCSSSGMPTAAQNAGQRSSPTPPITAHPSAVLNVRQIVGKYACPRPDRRFRRPRMYAWISHACAAIADPNNEVSIFWPARGASSVLSPPSTLCASVPLW